MKPMPVAEAMGEEVDLLTVERDEMREVVNAAIRWWRGRRPLSWTESEHCLSPCVNCVTQAEDFLAQRVAGYCARKTGRSREYRRVTKSRPGPETRAKLKAAAE